MATRVNTLLYSAGGDLSRPTRYRLKLSVPTSIMSMALPPDRTLDILCKGFSIPERKVEVLDYKYRGRTAPIPGPTTNINQITMTLILDDAHRMKSIFDEWLVRMDLREDISTGGAFSGGSSIFDMGVAGTIDGMYTTLTFSAMNWEEDEEMATYTFYGVYPSSVGEIQYSTDSPSSTQELTVTFSFITFAINKTGIDLLDSLLGGVNNIVNGAKNFVTGQIQGAINSVTGGIGKGLVKAVDIFGNGW